MSDIVERLRNPRFVTIAELELELEPALADMREAADEIERLRAEVNLTRSTSKFKEIAQ